MALAACGPQPEAPAPEAPPASETPATETQQDASRRTPHELDAVFAEAAAEFDVPVNLLKAISYAETRFENIRGEEEFEGRPAAHGVLGLRGQLIEDGALLAGESAEAVRTEPRANLRAGAALLSKFAAEAGIDRADLGAWAPVAVRLTDIADPDIQAHYIHEELYAVLAEGATALTPEGKVAVSLAPSAVEAKFALPKLRAFAAGPDYAASIWRPSPNYNARPAGTDISMIVIHTCEGGYSGCWGWLTNSAAGVSAHYVVNESGSEISQLVSEANRAWHVGASYDCDLNGRVLCGNEGLSVNHFSVGIEHGGYASQASFPSGQIESSAKLSCDISKGRGIVRDSYHIVAHGRLQPASRTDPGPNWPWSTYISRIKSLCGDGGTPSGAIVVDSHTNTSNARFSVVGSWSQGTSAGYYGSGYYFAATEAVSAPAVFEFYLPAAATKTIDAWWVAGTNRSPTAPFIVTTSSGNVTVNVNQQINGGRWNTLGTWSFPAGWNKVQLSRWTGSGYVVMADAIQVR
ncbi:N-acetylmuramoyl-L-alanine amidase [Pyxidicoccus fallax]|uniref:N-acetylmuramoyl-L-alanine amidase n=2 Tax=Pyxidicoccus fallax TaxID=394095 RepID=A0A848LKP7_9BACT|nr:N-acetylmuramoyl-L-alanine amidase [Pyxidicoccus fallax]NMO18224.1 N-acetylmuramoyl-L-alanine amidase [Pyxidicoccus fallax]NPC80150.1 N-acetylmuramoyl-L-alanine amidase [Pyxidicoccus fallax]